MLHTDIVVYAKIVGDRHRLTLGGHDIRWLSLAQQIDIHVETRNFRVDIFSPHVVYWLLAGVIGAIRAIGAIGTLISNL